MTTFYLVRHGETHWNVEHRWQGHLDSSLTKRGIQQVTELAEKLKGIHFDAVYSSDLPRAVVSAQILNQHMKIDLRVSSGLRERNAGPIAGTTAADRSNQPALHQPFDAYLALRQADKWSKKPFPDFESNQEVALRFEAELNRLADQHHNEQLLIVAHGGNIRNFLAHIGFLPVLGIDTVRVENACLVVVEFSQSTFKVISATGMSGKKQE